jgi:hypothetical protein
MANDTARARFAQVGEWLAANAAKQTLSAGNAALANSEAAKGMDTSLIPLGSTITDNSQRTAGSSLPQIALAAIALLGAGVPIAQQCGLLGNKAQPAAQAPSPSSSTPAATATPATSTAVNAAAQAARIVEGDLVWEFSPNGNGGSSGGLQLGDGGAGAAPAANSGGQPHEGD